MMVEDNDNRTLSQRVQDGWVGRIVWWNEGIEKDGQCTDVFVLWEGWQTYVIDLAERARPIAYDPYPAQRPWAEMGTVRHLRFDPLEVSVDTRFYIDEVRLLSSPIASSSLHLVIGTGDPEGNPTSVSFYLDRDSRGFDGLSLAAREIGSIQASAWPYRVYLPTVVNRPDLAMRPLPQGPDVTLVTAELSTAGIEPGIYYLYACIDDSISGSCSYFPHPVQVTGRLD
jgi:hypothetical protein